MISQRPRIGSVLLLLAAAACIGALVWMAVTYSSPSCAREPFDQGRWLNSALSLAASNDPGCVRGGMAVDLLDRGALQNLSKRSVVELLGEPNSQHDTTYRYELGQCSGWGWQHSSLTLSFSSAGTVVRADFTRDTR